MLGYFPSASPVPNWDCGELGLWYGPSLPALGQRRGNPPYRPAFPSPVGADSSRCPSAPALAALLSACVVYA